MKRSNLDALIMEQENLNTLTMADIEAVQRRKLKRLLALEKEREGFYKHLPESISSLAELSSLPFTTDEDLAHKASGLLLTSQSQIRRVLSDATSGTTGAAKRVFYTEGDCEHTVRLFMAGLSELVFPGSVTMICMPFSGPYGLGELIAEAIERLGARPLKLGCLLSYGEFTEVMTRERPDSFIGMPVQLLSILRVCGKGSLQRALVSGDACPDSVLRCCEAILGAKLFPHYGSREMGLGGAVTCPAHKGMHLRENHVIAEIIDGEGRVLPRGEYGELVITTIGMEAMPLIRYRTGDYTRILAEPCPCGSELIRLDSLRRIGPAAEIAAMDEALFALEGLVDYKARRENGCLEITALRCGPITEQSVRDAVERLYPDTQIKARLSPVKPTDKTLYLGKRRIEE